MAKNANTQNYLLNICLWNLAIKKKRNKYILLYQKKEKRTNQLLCHFLCLLLIKHSSFG